MYIRQSSYYGTVLRLIHDNVGNTAPRIAAILHEDEAMAEFLIKGLHDSEEIRYVALPEPHYESVEK